MALTYKGRRYSLASIRKAVVAFLGALATFVGSFVLLVNHWLPTEWVAALGTAGALLTGAAAFLIKNARVIDRLDGIDPEDTPLFG